MVAVWLGARRRETGNANPTPIGNALYGSVVVVALCAVSNVSVIAPSREKCY